MTIDDPLILRFENIPVLQQDDHPVVPFIDDELLWSCWSLPFVMEVSNESLDVSEESFPAKWFFNVSGRKMVNEKNILEVLNFNPTPENKVKRVSPKTWEPGVGTFLEALKERPHHLFAVKE